jgi:hypothetical protein
MLKDGRAGESIDSLFQSLQFKCQQKNGEIDIGEG